MYANLLASQGFVEHTYTSTRENEETQVRKMESLYTQHDIHTRDYPDRSTQMGRCECNNIWQDLA